MDYSATARGPARTTDDSGPYVELMVGVYTDNQPDFTYLLPYEAKALFEGMRAFAEKGLATPFKIDYFATSLPLLLIFDDDLEAVKNERMRKLVALAEKGAATLAAASRGA